MSLIDVKRLGHKFHIKDAEGTVIQEKWAVKDVDFQAAKGKIVAVIGRNGSGKSTFARHLNGLLVPTEGTVYISGKNTAEPGHLLSIRKTVGMVFQNPDNQIVGNSVAEDVGFGLENLGVGSEQIWKTIYETLEQTGLSGYTNRITSKLSGGQKQRLAVASVMAMKPECIVMDEATSMLDPDGSKQILELVKDMNRTYGISVIMITHHIPEVLCADYIYVMENGSIGMEGKPEEILKQTEKLQQMGLETVFSQRVWYTLTKDNEDGNFQNQPVLSIEELVNKIRDEQSGGTPSDVDILLRDIDLHVGNGKSKVLGHKDINDNDKIEAVIQAEHLGYMYSAAGNQIRALSDVSFQIEKGEIAAIAGHTGSGKSTLLQLLNGLLKTKEGNLIVNGIHVKEEKNLRRLRQKIGFVFQYPEYQLFETTVLKDVMYGPLNFGYDKETAKRMSIEALELVDLDDSIYEMSPLELSGGQKKKVALAGILAYQPEILILDEPTAGLDAESKRNLFALIRKLNQEQQITVILVSHDMNDIYEMAEHLLVMDHGKLVYDGNVEGALSDQEFVSRYHLKMPDVLFLRQELRGDIC